MSGAEILSLLLYVFFVVLGIVGAGLTLRAIQKLPAVRPWVRALWGALLVLAAVSGWTLTESWNQTRDAAALRVQVDPGKKPQAV